MARVLSRRAGNDWFIDGKNTIGFIFTVPGNWQSQKSDPSTNHSTTSIGDAESYLVQKYYSQSAQVGLSWNFGQAHQTRYRKVGDLEEASRVGSGSGGGIGK